MRKIVIALMLISVAGILSAQRDPFFPPNPTTMGQGGSFTANAQGYNAFFFNPAGFARQNELTLISLNVYANMDKTIFDMLLKLANGEDPFTDPDTGGLPPELEGAFTEFQDSMEETIDYIDAADPDVTAAAFETAVETALADPENEALAADLQAALDSLGGSADSGTALAALIPVLASNPEVGDTILADALEEMETNGEGTAPAPPEVAAALDKALDGMFPSGNVNAGLMAGLGWVGSGLGIGLFLNADAGIYTAPDESLLQAKSRVLNSITLAGGMGFNLGEDLSIGFSVRPTILGYSSVNVSKFLQTIFGGALGGGGGGGDLDPVAVIFGSGVYKGFRIGFDVGALWDLGPFTLGATIKDLIPFPATYVRYDDPLDYLESLYTFSEAGSTTLTLEEQQELYNPLIPKLNIGAQFHPDLGVFAFIIDPRVGVDLYDLFGFLDAKSNVTGEFTFIDFLKNFNIGGEVKFLNTIAVRLGLNKGALAAGLGVRLLFLDVNTAISFSDFKEPLYEGQLPGFSQIGASFEFAFRF